MNLFIYLWLCYSPTVMKHWVNFSIIIFTIQRILIIYKPTFEKRYSNYFTTSTLILFLSMALIQLISYILIDFPNSCNTFECLLISFKMEDILFFYVPIEIIILILSIVFFYAYKRMDLNFQKNVNDFCYFKDVRFRLVGKFFNRTEQYYRNGVIPLLPFILPMG